MKTFICRWQNGDLSIVSARGTEDAVSVLYEVADATDAELFETKDFLIHFELDDNGNLVLQEFGEGREDAIYEKVTRYYFRQERTTTTMKTLFSRPSTQSALVSAERRYS